METKQIIEKAVKYFNCDISGSFKFYLLGLLEKYNDIDIIFTNENNHYDVHLKIIQLLQACTQLKYIDGSVGSYKDLMYGDRDVLLMVIAKLTSKTGRKITKKVKCSCGQENEIDYIPANYVYEQEVEKIKKYFNSNTCSYHFKLKNGTEVSLKPPTLGIVESLNNYIFYMYSFIINSNLNIYFIISPLKFEISPSTKTLAKYSSSSNLSFIYLNRFILSTPLIKM
jgi:hypothetical protein